MKSTLTPTTCSRHQKNFRRLMISASLLAVTVILGQNVRAADVFWSGNTLGNGTAWTTTANWAGGVLPTSLDNAIFEIAGTNSPITLNSTQTVGCITVGPTKNKNFSIRSLSSANGMFILNGIGGMVLSNGSGITVTFQPSTAGATFLRLNLNTDGTIYANKTVPGTTPPSAAGSIEITCQILETNGPHSLTLTGPGIVYLRTNNLYTGSTTVSNGTLEVDDVGTIGDGTGTLYLSGGNLQSGASKNGTTTTPIANPIVLTTDAYIYNRAGNANTNRYLALSGTVGGSGTLKIANPTSVVGNPFIVRFFGGFTNSLPVLVGETSGDYQDTIGSFSILEMDNFPTDGVQVWNGPISGIGSIIRGSRSASPGGWSIFTNNNTYSGGTTISSGTLFANNLGGSALGAGAVTVATNGTLGGNGAVIAATSVSLDGSGGTISPGATTNDISNIAVSSLSLGPGASYTWQISSATGTPGTDWDLITCSSGWTDAGSSGNPITIKVDSKGSVPTGWNSAIARDWVIIQSSSATGFDSAHFAVDSGSSFSGSVAGGFSTYVSGGALHLTYTPGGDFIINVPSGSQSETAGYGTITGNTNVVKIGNGEIVFDNPAQTYGGLTRIYAGTLSLTVDALNGSGALGANSSQTLLGNTTGTNSATLNISVSGVTNVHNVVVQAGSSGVKTIGTTLTGGTANYLGDVILQDNVSLATPSGGSDLFAGNFSGTGGVTIGGGGTNTMAGQGSYSGTSTLTGGTLNLAAKALGTNTFTISGASALDNTSGGSLTLNTCPQNWNADFTFVGTDNLNLGDGAVTMSSNRTLTVNNSRLTVGGPIAGTGFGLTKTGSGELSLTAATNSTYTGGTTNLAGTLAINGTATFGDGTGPLVLAGGNLRGSGTRAFFPISNPVQMTTSTRIYGDSTVTAPSSRYLPFTGAFTVTGGSTMSIDNTGSSNNTFIVRLLGGNYTTINWPIVIGDAGFDTPGAICELDLYNDNTTPVQTVSGLITGTGSILRSATNLNTGGTTILTAQNTFTGGVHFDSGAIGLGASSVSSAGVVVSGPLGTGNFTLGAANGEDTLTIFPSGGNRVIDNRIVLNGITNVVISGANDLTLTGPFNSGGVAKTLTVLNTGITTISGAITNTGSSAGGALTKSGSGILVLSGTNTYPGTTTANEGILLINNTAGSGTSTNTVTVNPTGTLGGRGTIAGSVTFASGGQAYLYKTNGFPDSPLTLLSDLTLNGNTVKVDLGGTTLGAGTYRLINYSGILTGSFNATPTIVNGSLAAGGSATIDTAVANQVNLVVVVAPQNPPGFPPGSVTRLSNGSISLVATGALGSSYTLWASTNVAFRPVSSTWSNISSGTVTVSPFTNVDANASNYPRRFYRYSTP